MSGLRIEDRVKLYFQHLLVLMRLFWKWVISLPHFVRLATGPRHQYVTISLPMPRMLSDPRLFFANLPNISAVGLVPLLTCWRAHVRVWIARRGVEWKFNYGWMRHYICNNKCSPLVYSVSVFQNLSDTEDASETDLAKHDDDDYVEIKEQWVFTHYELNKEMEQYIYLIYHTYIQVHICRSRTQWNDDWSLFFHSLAGCIKINWPP